MRKKEELISVIVPVYQSKEYTERCLTTVINQTYQNLEIILIDDGSTDGSDEICDRFAKHDSRIKVIHQKNHGLSYARNVGIEMSQGEYIVFVDGDDMIHPEYISYLYSLSKNTGAEIAQCDFLMVKDSEDVLTPQKIEHIFECCPNEIISKTYAGFEAVRYIVVWNKMYKKNVFQDIRFPEGKSIDDVYTTHKLYWNANKVAVSNLYMYWYVQREDSIINKKFSLERLDSVEASRLKCDFFKVNNLKKDYYGMTVQHYHNLWRNYYLVEENIENAKEILESLKSEAEAVQKEILESDEGILLEKLRTIYPHLSESEKQHYEAIYGERITYTWKAFFKFPYNRIQKNSKIAMFGAGGVGKSYYEQMKDIDGYELVVWVDNLWNNYVKEGYPVKPIKELFRTNYDYVLLAVQSKSVADEIKENLVSWGIDEEKIIWEYPDDRQGTRQEFITQSNSIPTTVEKKLIIMNTADYGNIGDQALTITGLKFLQNYFGTYNIVEISGRQWDATKLTIKEKIKDADIIFFVSGGYMGDLWTIESSRVKEIIESFPRNKKVFLPQSFYYSNSIAAETDRKFFENYNNILFIHREQNSYDFFIENIVKKEANLLFPDMVLYADIYYSEKSRRGIIGCFRLDKEKVNRNINHILYEYCLKNKIPYKVVDTLVDRNITRKTRMTEYKELLEKFSQAELIITDRLHGMLFSAITGTPCLAIDNISRKVSGVYKWIVNLNFINVISDDYLKEEDISSYLQVSANTAILDNLKTEFDKMAFAIKEWCEL